MQLPLNHQINHVTAVLDLDTVDVARLDAQPAIEQSRDLARKTRSALTILAFHSPPSLLSNLQRLIGESPHEHARRESRPALFGLARRLQQQERISVHCELLEREFDARAVADWLASSPTDLLVLAKPENRTAAGTLFAGLTQLIRQTGTPVWFTEQGHQPQAGVVAAVAGATETASQQVRALDHEVVDAARGLGELFDAHVHLVQATPRPLLGTLGLGGLWPVEDATSQAALARNLGKAKRKYLEKQQQALESFARAAGVADSVEQTVVAEGDPAEVVSNSAQALEAGLIVMGAGEKSRWEALLSAGTAESTLTLAPCDVLYVKDADGTHVRPQALLADGSLAAAPRPEEVDMLVSPRRYFRAPLDVVRDETLARQSKLMILQAWEEELENEAVNEAAMPQQLYEDLPDPEQLASVRSALSRLGAHPLRAA